jgi:hypothetical protein
MRFRIKLEIISGLLRQARFSRDARLHMEACMNNQSPSKRMLQNIERGFPQPQKCWGTRGTSLVEFLCLSLLAISLLLIGLTAQAQASSKQQDQPSSQESGFLGDYSKLQPDPKNPDLLIYWKDKSVLKHSSKFILEPVTVYLLPEAQQRGIDPEDLAMLARYFTKAVTDELTKSGRYEIVTEAGPGVMVVRVAITNVEPTGGKKNATLKGAATAASVAVAPGASLLVPRLSVGKVAIEGEIDDSVSGERMVAFMSSKGGRRFFSGLNAYKKWGDIQAAFRSWAKSFRKRLDEAHES